MKKQNRQSPYDIIKHQYVTEKTKILGELQDSNSNSSVRRCQSPKYVFVVDAQANKPEIAKAIEEIYQDSGIKVVSVNTIQVKGKPKRRGRFAGKGSSFKKAIVTLEKGDKIEKT